MSYKRSYTLHHIAPHCATLQHDLSTSFMCSVSYHPPSTLQHTVAHCSTLQYTAPRRINEPYVFHVVPTPHHTKHNAPRCITLHHAAPCCKTLHHTAPHCNTLQHTATRLMNEPYRSRRRSALKYLDLQIILIYRIIRRLSFTPVKPSLKFRGLP